MDKPTPDGFLQDAEEELGRARARRDQASQDLREWDQRVGIRIDYRDDLRAWIKAGATGPRPVKPRGY